MWKRIKAAKVLLPKKMSWKMSWRKMLLCVVLAGLMAGAFCLGRFMPGQAMAQPKEPGLIANNSFLAAHHVEPPTSTVAVIHERFPITRQDLGEYLIARFGPERLEFLINRKIVEHACIKHGITVTEAEIEAQLILDLKAMNVVRLEDFVGSILKKFGKSLYEYKEDVIRPKIALGKLCKAKVQVTEDDVKNAFEARYGPKVDCRILVFSKEDSKFRRDAVWADLKDDKEGLKFTKYAREQNVPSLASSGGKVPPIHKHFGDKRVEKEAFTLKPGEISAIIDMPDDTAVILRCEDLIAADNSRSLNDESSKLYLEVQEQKLAEAIPKLFQELREQAKPAVLLQREKANDEARRRINTELLKGVGVQTAPKQPPVPAGLK